MPFSQSSSAAASYMGRALPPAEGWMPRAALAAALQKHKARFSLALDAGAADAAPLLDQTLKELPYYTAEAFEALSGRYILAKENAASWGG